MNRIDRIKEKTLRAHENPVRLVHPFPKKSSELSEIIMEINDLRDFNHPSAFAFGFRRRQAGCRGEASGSSRWPIALAPTPISKNGRMSATQLECNTFNWECKE
jgi:hypothetical protein